MHTASAPVILVATLVFHGTALAAATFNPPPLQCLGPVDEQVCGYTCERNFSTTRCTRTPHGRCISAGDKVLCWDPSPALIAVLGDDVPAPQCIANFGDVACGYGCVAGAGQVQCAQTPYGVCAFNFGKLVCFDPPLQALSLVEGEPPPSQCLSGFEQLACGYGCAANFGHVKCAQTPVGRCVAQGGQVVCVDPPVDGLPLVRRTK